MRRLGRDGPLVSLVGLGRLAMSDIYGSLGETGNIATIQPAAYAGVPPANIGFHIARGDLLKTVRESEK